ncbi:MULTISPECIES: aromatic ring-hydroxylating dioxygenase subunit alpha [Paraburkholderia]|uniref:aromatic ring-hydroxylating dioxygenase subunit alpha n=1 Tax=Paraburkholderia TaxID=1822464 RepID=UPI00225B5E71|nr:MULTISPECIES: aromatic ring-hydroxylating dioxygenase subunit alpha [Paraburkholderia]MCX4176975.1 aromatic ring-hydroxylating dioxygenase subunit alpha [Paraburkholderia madseniana]MDQ6464965.1 aromatic ring-hydroxylating dioxygenase subunit alpha [Paraburkholderia madseniana]
MTTDTAPLTQMITPPAFPMNQWWVAGFGWELRDKPIPRKILNRPIVFFRLPSGDVGALEDRCCHKELPLSCGTVESMGVRCGYHGMLFDSTGACLEIPGQDRVPAKAKVTSYPVQEQDQIIWVWIGASPDDAPTCPPPSYPIHSRPDFQFGGGSYHYEAPYQLIHDNLMDLSHLGYVHLKTIGGNANVHMGAETRVTSDGDVVHIVRLMPDSEPPPTYTAAWPFRGHVDRWQEIDFHVTHIRIWTGAMDVGSGRLDDSQREGFHMRGFHGITPETETTTHYFWSMATNPHPEMENVTQTVIDQSAATFDEDKTIIEAQYKNQLNFSSRTQLDIHVDVGPNRARRIIDRLVKESLNA